MPLFRVNALRSPPPPSPPRRSSSRRLKESALKPAMEPRRKPPEYSTRCQHRQQQEAKQQARVQRRHPVANQHNYVQSHEDRLSYAARMKCLVEARATQAGKRLRSLRGLLANAANSGGRVGQKSIMTYNETSQSPTKDLQTLVLVLTRLQLHEEVVHLNEVVNDQSPFEMRNMRLKSLIANTQDIMDHWKAAMLAEGMRVIDETCELDEMAWVTPGPEQKLAMVLDEQMLVFVPPDKPEISKSQVATEYIQAQRGHQGRELDELMNLFQNELLRAEFAASASTEMFERVCNCYRVIIQKVVEIEYIEGNPEIVRAVSNYVEQLRSSEDQVVQEAMTQNLVDSVEQGRMFVRALINVIMNDLHARHQKTGYDAMRVHISIPRPS